MTDILVKLPPSFRYLNQFAPSAWAKDPSLELCGETSTAMAAEIAYPGKWIPEELVAELCLKWTGQPDTVADQMGTTKEEILAWLTSGNIGHIDMSAMVAALGQTQLHVEVMAQNRQNVAQIITIADESQLYEAVPNPAHATDANAAPYIRGAKLHNWNDKGLGHVILRVGYSDDGGYGYYMEPAAPGFAQPVRILFSDILAARIITAIAIMPAGVEQTPSGFLYSQGTWPPPAPVLDVAGALTDVESILASENVALQAIVKALGASVLGSIETSLASKLGAIEQKLGKQ